jgi:hypothetical protein
VLGPDPPELLFEGGVEAGAKLLTPVPGDGAEAGSVVVPGGLLVVVATGVFVTTVGVGVVGATVVVVGLALALGLGGEVIKVTF